MVHLLGHLNLCFVANGCLSEKNIYKNETENPWKYLLNNHVCLNPITINL